MCSVRGSLEMGLSSTGPPMAETLDCSLGETDVSLSGKRNRQLIPDFLDVLLRNLVARVNIKSVHKLGQSSAVIPLLAKLFPAGNMRRGRRKTSALPRGLIAEILRVLLEGLCIVLIGCNHIVFCLG